MCTTEAYENLLGIRRMLEDKIKALEIDLDNQTKFARDMAAENESLRAYKEAAPDNQKSAARVTEEDAYAIAESFQFWSGHHFIDDMFIKWIEAEGRDLLNSLNSDRCPSHESDQQLPDEELPGMWSNSDLSGGWADSHEDQLQNLKAAGLAEGE
jgi:hypothetical protein